MSSFSPLEYLDEIGYFNFTVGFMVFKQTFESYLDYRQHERLKLDKPKDLTYITDEEFTKSQKYLSFSLFTFF